MLDLQEIRKDFPMLNKKTMQNKPLIYLDNSATTLKPQCVIDAVVDYYENYSANAHRGDYDLSYQVDQKYSAARKAVADFIGARKEEIIYTSGATAGLNMVAIGFGMCYLQPGDVILTSEAEHASNLLPWQRCAMQTGASLEYIPLLPNGRLDMQAYQKMLKSGRVRIVALAQVTNVLGYLLPMEEICALAHAYGAYVVVDGAQSVPHIPVDVKAMDCDFLAFSAHKMCGPTGIGILYGKKELLEQMQPIYLGGDSNARYDRNGNMILKDIPYRFESGTQPIEAIFGLHAAIQYLTAKNLARLHEYECELHQYAVEEMQKMDHIILYNADNDTGIITFNVKNVFAQDAAKLFNAQGIAVRSGQHCSKLLEQQLGCMATIRASLYFYTTKEEIDTFLDACRRASMETCLDIFF